MHHDSAGSRHHAQHDLTLIAAAAADDLSATERTRAQALLDSCTECSTLRDDLVAIARATRALPAPAAPRDFRISAAQAAQLTRTGWLGRLLAPFSSSRSAARPLATAFTTLGLAGVFVATLLPAMLGGAASMAVPEAAPGAGGSPLIGVTASQAPASQAPASQAHASEAPAQLGPAAASSGPDAGYGSKDNAQASAVPAAGQADGGTGRDLDSQPDGRLDAPAAPVNLLLAGSLALLATGLLLFGLRFAGRRLR